MPAGAGSSPAATASLRRQLVQPGNGNSAALLHAQSFQKSLIKEYGLNHIGILDIVQGIYCLIQEIWETWLGFCEDIVGLANGRSY